MLRIQLLFGAIALFVQIALLCSSVCRLPSNSANGVAVFEGSPMRYNNARLLGLIYNTCNMYVNPLMTVFQYGVLILF